jgi:Periplasmic binding protein-like domain
MRILSAVHGKGFFVRSDGRELPVRVFVLFESLSPYKEKVYAGMMDEIGGRAELDIWFHHFNPRLFKRIVSDAAGEYDRYVVTAFADPTVGAALGVLDPRRLLLLDLYAQVAGDGCAWIIQNFDAQLVRALSSGLGRLRDYSQFTLVFPPDKHHPLEIRDAFRRFGEMHDLKTSIVPKLTEQTVEPGVAYLVIEDSDLVSLVKYCDRTGHRLGREVGVISYNDTPLKEIVAGGISVVSIDFYDLGRRAGREILEPSPIRDIQPTRLLLRKSL